MCSRLALVCAECFCEGGDDKRIPLLQDVFDAFPNTPVNVDIKVDNGTLIKKVCVGASVTALSVFFTFPLNQLQFSSWFLCQPL